MPPVVLQEPEEPEIQNCVFLWLKQTMGTRGPEDPLVVAEASRGLGLVLVLVSLPIGLASGFVSIEAVLTSSHRDPLFLKTFGRRNYWIGSFQRALEAGPWDGWTLVP